MGQWSRESLGGCFGLLLLPQGGWAGLGWYYQGCSFIKGETEWGWGVCGRAAGRLGVWWLGQEKSCVGSCRVGLWHHVGAGDSSRAALQAMWVWQQSGVVVGSTVSLQCQDYGECCILQHAESCALMTQGSSWPCYFLKPAGKLKLFCCH